MIPGSSVVIDATGASSIALRDPDIGAIRVDVDGSAAEVDGDGNLVISAVDDGAPDRSARSVSLADLDRAIAEPPSDEAIGVEGIARNAPADMFVLDGRAFGLVEGCVVEGCVVEGCVVGVAQDDDDPDREVAVRDRRGDDDGLDLVSAIRAISIGNDRAVLDGDRTVFGVSLRRDSLDLDWSVDGILRDVVATEQGVRAIVVSEAIGRAPSTTMIDTRPETFLRRSSDHLQNHHHRLRTVCSSRSPKVWCRNPWR